MGKKIIGLEKLSGDDLIRIARILLPAPFINRGEKYWKVVPFSELGIEFPGKAIVSKRNNYRFEFSFDTGDIEVLHENMGDYNSRVCPCIENWWSATDYLKEKGCSLATIDT